MSKKIIIIDNSDLSYSGEDIDGTILRGTETSLILLSEQLHKMGCQIDYSNEIKEEKIINGVRYFNKKNIDKKINYDLAIVVSDANQFALATSLKKAVFSVSNQPFEKFLRKKQLIPFLKFKPTVVTLCNYQYEKRSFITSFYGKKIIPITIDPKFLSTEVDLDYLPKKQVVYNIRSNRNLDRLIKIWIEKIYPKDHEFKLFITPDLIKYSDYHKKNNIFLRKIGSRQDMIDELSQYRALTYLGHKSDIFTLTAEEAVKLCLPVVTFGIGSLADRVQHNKTGFVAINDDDFANYTIKLMNDDKFYLETKAKMFEDRYKNNWESIASEWIDYFLTKSQN